MTLVTRTLLELVIPPFNATSKKLKAEAQVVPIGPDIRLVRLGNCADDADNPQTLTVQISGIGAALAEVHLEQFAEGRWRIENCNAQTNCSVSGVRVEVPVELDFDATPSVPVRLGSRLFHIRLQRAA